MDALKLKLQYGLAALLLLAILAVAILAAATGIDARPLVGADAVLGTAFGVVIKDLFDPSDNAASKP